MLGCSCKMESYCNNSVLFEVLSNNLSFETVKSICFNDGADEKLGALRPQYCLSYVLFAEPVSF